MLETGDGSEAMRPQSVESEKELSEIDNNALAANGCNCLFAIKVNLTSHHGLGSEVELELKPFLHKPSMTLGTAMPPLYYTYFSGKNRKRSYVTFNFCPFCGKEL